MYTQAIKVRNLQVFTQPGYSDLLIYFKQRRNNMDMGLIFLCIPKIGLNTDDWHLIENAPNFNE